MRKLALMVGLLALITWYSANAQQYPIVHNNTPNAASTMAFWTPERMKAAKPVDLPALQGGPRAPSSVEEAMPSGQPGAAGGILPDGTVMKEPLPQSALEELANGPPVPTNGPYPGPYTNYKYYPAYAGQPVKVYSYFPWWTIGRLFFSEPSGEFVCTAAATYGGAVTNIVWTAGHCVANGGHQQFYTNWMFCPGWNELDALGGENPVGCWPWVAASTTGGWYTSGALTKDYAWVALANHSDKVNENVVNVTGGLGFAWNWARDQHWSEIGYPAEAPYDGGFLVRTETEFRYTDTPDSIGPPTNSWGSPQTPGASGSPMLLFWNFGGGYINGDVSYYYLSQAFNELQGPYMDTDACNFWKSGTGYSGSC